MNLLMSLKLAKFFKAKPESVPEQSDNQSVLLPPGPLWSRLFLWFLASGTFALLIWSFLAKVQDVVVLSGSLRSLHPVATVSIPLGGRVHKVFVAPFERVDSGQPLLQLDVSDQKIQLHSLRERLDLLEVSYKSYQKFQIDSLSYLETQLSDNRDLLNRYQQLSLSGSMAYVQVLNQKNRVSQLQTRLVENTQALADKTSSFRAQQSQLSSEIDLLENLIKRCTLYSPVRGIVQSQQLPSPGVYLAAGSNVAEVVPSGSLTAQVKLPSQYRDNAQPGIEAMVDVDAFPSREFGLILSEIVSVSPTTYESSSPSIPKTYLADLKLLQAERSDLLNINDLLPGMKVSARISLRTKPIIATVFEFFEGFFSPILEER